jgi:hypothetical protein
MATTEVLMAKASLRASFEYNEDNGEIDIKLYADAPGINLTFFVDLADNASADWFDLANAVETGSDYTLHIDKINAITANVQKAGCIELVCGGYQPGANGCMTAFVRCGDYSHVFREIASRLLSREKAHALLP